MTTFYENVDKDVGRQVEYFNNMILQHQFNVSTFDNFKICLDKLSIQVDNVTSLVEGMVVGSQGPPTVP